MLSAEKPSLSEPASAIKSEATRLGFDLVGIAPAVSPIGFHDFQTWLSQNLGGEMNYLHAREAAYAHPSSVLENVASIVMLAINYRSEEPQPAGIDQGLVSRYAWGESDYHDLIRGKLKQLARFVESLQPGCRTRGVVDTAPLLERDFARLAGLGWFGKNTMLINKKTGSWFFLAALLVDFALDADQPHDTSHCGTCTRCLDACPTDAFPEPYVLDAKKCISYLTIEHKGHIAPKYRAAIGNRIYGCDDCLAVCPWNKFAQAAGQAKLRARPHLVAPRLADLAGLDDAGFREAFAGSPIKRTGRDRFVRNVLIGIGNSRDAGLAPAAEQLLDDASPLVRAMAVWALGRLVDSADMQRLATTRQPREADARVRREWAMVLENSQGTKA